jgi:ribosome assembly protein YihI (activator of Der GTPase)
MLRRRPQESLQQLLERLDEAIGLAWNKQEFTDEINTAMLTRPRR